MPCILAVSYTHLDVYKRQEYSYAFITRQKDTAYMIFRVENNEKAIEVLTKNGITPICQDALNEL